MNDDSAPPSPDDRKFQQLIDDHKQITREDILQAACSRCSVEMMKQLLSRSVSCLPDDDEYADESCSALHTLLVLWTWPEQTVNPVLLECIVNAYGSRINALCNGVSPLHAALEADCPLHIVQLLVERGASVKQQSDWGESALSIAVSRHSDVKVVECLLGAGADATLNTGLLADAADRSNLAMLKTLLEHGADPNKRSAGGLLAYDCALAAEAHGCAALLKWYMEKHKIR